MTDAGPFPDYGLTPEQRREAVTGHYYEYPGMDGPRGEIWAYSDRITYAPGEIVTLFVSTTAPRFDLEIARDGAALRPVLTRTGIEGRWQDTPADCSVTGCGWSPAFAFEVEANWPSGAYRVTLRAEGGDGQPIVGHHLFVVRPPAHAPRAGRLLQVAATGTWTAYNTWGGSNHYQGITGADGQQYAPVVSLERPWARGFTVLPEDAPRVPLEVSVPPGASPRYPHMEWAFAKGYSKKYASAGWASYDSHFFRWAERAGYAVDLVAQHDLHFRPDVLDGYACAVFTGHDEYWTWEMRDAIDAFVEGGGRAARFAGNFMWQTRLADEGRRQVCYKYRARAEDPVYRSADTTRTTTSWEAPEVGRPGAATFGLNATRGLYIGWGGCAPRGVRGFPVYRPEHWAFKGTGLYYGDILGADSHIFGYEVDGAEYVIRNGVAEALPTEGVPEGMEVLALGVSSLVEENADIPAYDQFLTDADARFVAETLIGDARPASIEQIKRGCGMIVNFAKGAGEVFHAGSCEWVAGLKRRDPMVERVTANVLDRYLGG